MRPVPERLPGRRPGKNPARNYGVTQANGQTRLKRVKPRRPQSQPGIQEERISITPLCLIGLMALAMAGCADFKIVANNRPQAEIVLPAGAGDNLKKDVACFNASLEKTAQTGLPAVANRTPGKNAILFDVRPMALADDDTFTIDFPDARTMRIACSQRSSRWALNHILQEHAGVLPLYDKETFYPSLTNLAVPRRTVTRSASFNLRREMNNPYIHEMFAGWNGKAELSYVHRFAYEIFPATKYARNQSWPAEIMPVIGGKKTVLPPPKANTPDDKLWEQYTANWQPCWSNPKTADIAADNILEGLAADPGKKSIPILPNDKGFCCECDACRKVVGNKLNVLEYQDYSELYYTWVNKVAAKVAARYPKVYFSTEAYREVKTPPSFKLHPNVAVGVDVDTYATVDPDVRKKRWALIDAWSEKTAILGLSDYAYGTYCYLIPRIYYKLHARYIKDFYGKGGRAALVEGWPNDPSEGPKLYLMMQLFWDVSADPEKLINAWITACVGAQAAPYLRQYYQFWEDYWMGADIRKTRWFESKNATYMALCELSGTHTFALKEGDMARCRKLMEQVVANAATPDQQRRARHLLSLFEFSELATTALFSELIPPEGRLESSDQAVAMLKSVPAAIKAAETFHKAPGASRFCFQGNDPQLLPYLANNLSLVLPFLDDPAVNAALTALADQRELPPLLRGQFRLWLGRPAANLLENGSFELEAPLPDVRTGDIKRVRQYKFSGEYSLMTDNCTFRWRAAVQAGQTYLIAARVFIPQNSAEGLFGIRLAPGVDDINSTWQNLPSTRLTAGEWNLVSRTIAIPANSHCGVPNRLDLYLDANNFEKNERVYIDDVKLIGLDEPKAVKAGP